MSGSIGIFSRRFERLHLFTGYEVGNRDSHDVWLGLSKRWSRVAVSGAARAFTTDGYYIVPEERRGTADTQGRRTVRDGRCAHRSLHRVRAISFKGDVLAEERTERHPTDPQFDGTGNRFAALRAAVQETNRFRCWASTRGRASTAPSIR